MSLSPDNLNNLTKKEVSSLLHGPKIVPWRIVGVRQGGVANDAYDILPSTDSFQPDAQPGVLRITSTNANDGATGTGVRTIGCKVLDLYGEIGYAVMTPSGIANQPGTTGTYYRPRSGFTPLSNNLDHYQPADPFNIWRVLEARVLTAGALGYNAGIIRLDTGTGGVYSPTQLLRVISPPYKLVGPVVPANVSHCAWFTVPKGFVYLLAKGSLFVNDSNNGTQIRDLDFSFMSKQHSALGNGTFFNGLAYSEIIGNKQGDGPVIYDVHTPMRIPELTDIWVRAFNASSATIDTNVLIEGKLVAI